MRTRTGQPPQAFHPARIGPYEVVRRLGAGAMGEVFLARSASSRLVAVKTIRAGLAEHPGYRRRFAHEVDAAKRVSGAFTAAVVGADPHADLPWLATVYVPAPSLEELVTACGPLAVSAVRWLAAGCAEALECVHRAGLVHRDFKPANVLVTADGPRVIDFGLARSDGLPQGTAVGMVMGTPLYMAPEQAMGDRDVGPAADVFALGATLYHAATGAALYQEEKAVGVLLHKMRQPPDLTPLPSELRGLVAGCLALEPGDRPTPASLLAALAPHLATADAARPLPEAVLAYVEDYRGTQMELARSRRPLPQAATALIWEPTHVAEPFDSFGDGDGSGDGNGGGDSGGGTGTVDEDVRSRHPSLPPGVEPVDLVPSGWVPADHAPTNRRRARTGWWSRDGFGRRSPVGPTVVAVSVLLALGVAAIGGLLLIGSLRTGNGGSTGPAAGAAPGPASSAASASASATTAATRPTGSPPGTPPPTNSPPPQTRPAGPPLGGPPPQGPPISPPPGAVTEIDGTRLGVRPPFGDPRTTYILNGVGWPAGQTVTVTFLNGAAPPVKTVVDGSGTFSVALDQGAGSVLLPDGRYHVRASSGARSLSVSFVVGPPLN
ncbi:serine/threonine-protein kinase [Catenulispora pinisilvae]|uniref:serine/threonine-protein kinase n=1 Tax=Catenulispora pinisilvae TaxID=2705253 RepID=UPI0018926B36|nr:serine/threonine-protein kinase [Catenulispora pinisilvae]